VQAPVQAPVQARAPMRAGCRSVPGRDRTGRRQKRRNRLLAGVPRDREVLWIPPVRSCEEGSGGLGGHFGW